MKTADRAAGVVHLKAHDSAGALPSGRTRESGNETLACIKQVRCRPHLRNDTTMPSHHSMAPSQNHTGTANFLAPSLRPGAIVCAGDDGIQGRLVVRRYAKRLLELLTRFAPSSGRSKGEGEVIMGAGTRRIDREGTSRR